MRLLHLQGDAWEKGPLELAICEFVADDAPPYLIVSHRWREDEVLFADLNVSPSPDAQSEKGTKNGAPSTTDVETKISSSSAPNVELKKGFAKLQTSCRIASQMGLRYLWIDTCCIDKSSSSDVSEAVVSTYDWYANARCCIAYLDDIHVTSDISQSSWFTRGWTLPELIAPEQVIFYSTDWIELGTKASLSLEVSIATGIDESVLWHRNSLDRVCVSEKLSWAARRNTTRPEDESYALMGLFGIRMLPIYGEGRERAFMRLQTEIMQITADHTLFVWNSSQSKGHMLAPRVSCFLEGALYEPCDYSKDLVKSVEFASDFGMTNIGLRIALPRSSIPRYDERLLFAILACRHRHKPDFIAICLQQRKNIRYNSFFRLAFDGRTTYHLTRDPSKKPENLVTQFDLAHISPMRSQEEPLVNSLGPPQVSVQFEFHIKAKKPYSQVVLSNNARHAMNDPPPPPPDDDAPPGYSVIAPPTYDAALTSHPENYSASTLPTQHRFTGSFPTRSFHSEVVQLRGTRTIDVAFGSLGSSIWFHMLPPRFDAGQTLQYGFIAADYAFPSGHCWRQAWSHTIVFLEGFNPKYAKLRDFSGTQHSIEIVVRNDQIGAILVNIYLVVDKPSRLPFK